MRTVTWIAVAVLTAIVIVIAVGALRGSVHTPQRRVGIIGGVPVPNSTLPALAYVRVRWQHTVVQCTGTLVAPNTVLTAAHCLENSHTGQMAAAAQVRILVGPLYGISAHRPEWTIRRIFVLGGSQHSTESPDAALLVMNKSTTLSPILLAAPGSRWLGAPRAEMIGWSTNNLLPSAVLDAKFSRSEKVGAQTVVQTSGWCEERVWHFDAQYDLCTIDPPSYSTGGCVGTSGGPLITSNMSPAVEIGMMIRGPAGCSPHRPTVFIQIGAIRKWITAQLATVSTPESKDTSATG